MPNDSASLNERVARYSAAVAELDQAPNGQLQGGLIRALVARDALTRLLDDAELISQDLVGRVNLIDEELRRRAPQLDTAIGTRTLSRWRETLQPPADSWWWSLDRVAAAARPAPSPLWGLGTGFLFTVSLSIAADTSSRLLSEGPDIISVFSTLVQGIFALVAGSQFVETGKRGLDSLLLRLRGMGAHLHRWYAGLGLLLLVVVIAIRLLLPILASYYNTQADRAWDRGDSETAVDQYRRSLSADADVATVHLALANAHDRLGRFEEARSEYLTAIRANRSLYDAYVALTRLLILNLDDSAGALGLLNQAFATSPQDANALYRLHTARGWANFDLGFFGAAIADLRQALQARSDGAAAACLLTQVLGSANNPAADQQAALQWAQQCVALAERGAEPVEAAWVGFAREQLWRAGR